MATNMSDGCPYKGLQPYGEEDREYFFGRERDKEVIASNLFVAPLTILYGSSGVGKSSVLQAGAIPQLRQNPRVILVLFSHWQGDTFDMALKNEVLKAICENTGKQRADVLLEVGKILGLKETPSLEKLAFDDLITGCASAFKRRILIIFDQFEEYFLYHPPTKGAQGFDAEFARAVNQQESGVNFMLAMREEELSKLDRFRPRIPNLLSNLLRLDHLDREAAINAIRKPLDVYNDKHPQATMDIKDDLIEEVIKQVRPGAFAEDEDGQLAPTPEAHRVQSESKIETPFLQMVLVRLWEEEKARHSRALRLSTFQELGGAKQIARAHLDRVMAQLSDSQRNVAASVLRFLVTPKGSKIALDTATLAGFATQKFEDVEAVLILLSFGKEMRILRKVTVARHPDRYELFHDVLGPAILEWRARYVQAQQLVEQRAEAEQAFTVERQRRLRQALVVLVGLLFIMGGLTVFALAQTARANQQRGEAEKQRAEAERQGRIANDALAKAKQSQEELQKAKKNVEEERDKTKEQARLLGISEQAARVSEHEALKAKGDAVVAQHTAEDATGRANRQKAEIEDIARILNLALYGFDAIRGGHADEAIKSFTDALNLSRKQKNASLESYNLLNIGDSYAIKSGVLQADAMRSFDSLGDESDKTDPYGFYFSVYNASLGTDLRKLDHTRNQAIGFYADAVQANERIKDIPRLASINQRLGDVYFSAGIQSSAETAGKAEPNFDKAVDSYSKASEQYHQVRLYNEEGTLLNRVGLLLLLSSDSKDKTAGTKAINYYERAREAFKLAEDGAIEPSARDEIASKEASVLFKLGAIYKNSADVDSLRKAISYYEQAAPIYDRIGESGKAGDGYSTIGELRFKLLEPESAFENYKKARSAYRAAQALAKVDSQKTEMSTKAMQMLNQIGMLYKDDLGGRPKLQTYYESVIETYRNDPAGKASVLDSIANLFKDALKDQPKAIEYYTRESQAWKEAGKHLEEGNTLFRIGVVYKAINDRKGAIESFDQARTAYGQVEASVLNDSKLDFGNQVVGNLFTMATYSAQQGDKYSALKTYQEAMAISLQTATFEQKTSPAQVSNYRMNEIVQAGAKILIELRDEQVASIFFGKVFDYYGAVNDSYEGSAREAAGNVYAELGKTSQAIEYYKKASEAYQKRNYYYQFDVLKKIGKLYFDLPDQNGAKDYFEGVVNSYRTKNDTQGEASALAAIGASYNELGKKQEAINYYEQALKARIKVNDRSGQVNVLRALSNIYKELGQKEKSDELSRQAEALVGVKK